MSYDEIRVMIRDYFIPYCLPSELKFINVWFFSADSVAS
jgi:hypothetical protein